MRVKVKVKNLVFSVPCGDGEQSLKWLSMVAAQQYEIRKPSGRARSREPANSSRGFFLPMGLHSGKGEAMRDPNAKINEVFVDGAEVMVELMETVEVDAIGAPALSDWQQKCFCVGEATKLKLSCDMNRKEEERRRQLQQKRFETNVAMSSNIGGIETIGIEAVNQDHYDWSSIVEVLADSSEKDQEEIEKYFPEVYPLLQVRSFPSFLSCLLVSCPRLWTDAFIFVFVLHWHQHQHQPYLT